MNTREAMGFEALHPLDQAHGLRCLFTGAQVRFVPLLSNPHVAFGGVLIDQLLTTLAGLGRHTLLVDAAERSQQPQELASVDLAQAVEPLAPRVSYLAARGLPLRHLNSQGSMASFLDALAQAAPQADVVLVHASATDLARVFMRRAARPIVLACDHPVAVTHAYAGIKLLVQRAGLRVHGLVLGASADSPRAERIARHLSDCADLFLAAVVHGWARIDPSTAAGEPPSVALHQLVRDSLIDDASDELDDDAPRPARTPSSRSGATPTPPRS